MSPRIIHIAGSKGKGTTAYLLAVILQDHGFKVGLFTSPWILQREEMIQVNGAMISKEKLEQILSSLDPKYSEFEQLTLAAFEHFRREECDFWVLECGWGGSIDATNWVEQKDLALLTHVELEHTDVLGDTLEAITKEQLGIVSDGVPLITLPNQDAAVYDVIEKEGLEYRIAAREELGTHHPESAGLAIAAAAHFGLNVEGDLRKKLKEFVIPGRFQILEIHGKTVILDGAHTPDSIAYFLERLAEHADGRDVHFAVHFLKDKHPQLWEFFPHEKTVWIPLNHPRAGTNRGDFRESSLEGFLNEPGVHLHACCGSFVLLGELIKVGNLPT